MLNDSFSVPQAEPCKAMVMDGGYVTCTYVPCSEGRTSLESRARKEGIVKKLKTAASGPK